ncbi:MAG: hypothetical protein KF833_06490 [Verrucomicrobiae bacterium]|nr:hypothetical protein [Verrucomicrobiae bacterium]
MNLHRLCLLILLVVVPDSRSGTTNQFAIYLIDEPVDRRLIASGQGDWSGVRLAASPVISQEDLVRYDATHHTVRLKPGVLDRIPKLPGTGVPFVVVAGGERIYMGAFMTIYSSASVAVPVILVDRPMFGANQPPDTLIIERAYPSSIIGVGSDPRADPRLTTALKTLGKLESSE